MHKHAALAFSTMHYGFFRQDRLHIDATIAALIEADKYRDEFDFPEIQARLLNEVRGWKEAWAAPRGNAKSTIKTRIETLRDICYQLEEFIVIFSNTGGQAEGRTWEVMRELSIGKNKRIERDFGKISGEYTSRLTRVWGRSHFITHTGIRVMASSMMSESRGIADGENRPTKVIFDDLENNEHVMSAVQRAKAEDWFTKVPLKLGGPNKKCNFSLAGTVIHQESLLAYLLKNPGWRGTKYQSIVSWPTNQKLWDECKAIWIDLDNDGRKVDAKAFYLANKEAMDVGAEVLWPAGEPLYDLYEMLWTDGAAAFNSEKQNEPWDPSKQILRVPDTSFFTVKQNAYAQFEIHRRDGRIVPLNQCTVVAWLDPAQPKEKSVDPDYACIVVMAIDTHGYGYVLDVWMKKANSSVYLPAVIELHKRWHFDLFDYEANGFQELCGDTLKRLCAEEYEKAHKAGYTGFPYWDVPMRGRVSSTKKVIRIAKLEAPLYNGWLLFNEGLPQEFWQQMNSFPSATHDDGPDALEGAWTTGTVRSYTPTGGNYA